MSRRLIRALQRGGLAAQIEEDRWGIWRTMDRRGRMVGAMSGAEIELLRMRETLRPSGDGRPPILVWSGPILDQPVLTPSASVLERADEMRGAPLLESVLSRCLDLSLRRMIRETVQVYRADVECVHRAGAVSGMNWDSLALGGKISGGQRRDSAGYSAEASRAMATLSCIHNHLNRDEIAFLDRLILGEESRAALAKRYDVRSALMEQRAISAVRTLANVYNTRIKVSG